MTCELCQISRNYFMKRKEQLSPFITHNSLNSQQDGKAWLLVYYRSHSAARTLESADYWVIRWFFIKQQKKVKSFSVFTAQFRKEKLKGCHAVCRDLFICLQHFTLFHLTINSPKTAAGAFVTLCMNTDVYSTVQKKNRMNLLTYLKKWLWRTISWDYYNHNHINKLKR